jgi:hypothetical protein
MKMNALFPLIYALLPLSVIACSGTAGGGKGTVADSTGVKDDSLHARRLIEVLAPADNAIIGCNDRIIFSIAQAASPVKIDSVQLWAGGNLFKTVKEVPATAEISAPGRPGRFALRAVAFSKAYKPQNVSLFVSLLSDITPAVYNYRIVNIYPHDRHAYTQGLVYDGGFFYEGTGQEGESSLRKVDPETGKVISQVNLDASLFGEGVALLDNRI